MTTTKFFQITETLNATDRELISYAHFAVRDGDIAGALDSLKANVIFMDNIDAGYELIGLFA